MRRRAVHRQAVEPSLFPFLAVLICTVGALVVLLVVVVQQARATAEAQAKPAAHIDEQAAARARFEELQVERQTYQWRIEMLKQSRDETVEQLVDHRLQLSHLEDHIRRLKDRLARLSQDAAELQRTEGTHDEDRQSGGAELRGLRSEISIARQQLQQARQQAGDRPRSFAVIPYDGPSGTQRRPIYVECRGDGVVLQPEGVWLTYEDFRAPLGPGNPLATALRATREYLAGQGEGRSRGEPYPLLIVRPDGADLYAAARQAMTSWETEFGYELIGQDVSLAYPAADSKLAELLEVAVRESRERRKRLALAAPSRYGRTSTPTLHARRRGGFAREGGDGDLYGGALGGVGRAPGRGGGVPPGRSDVGHRPGRSGQGRAAESSGQRSADRDRAPDGGDQGAESGDRPGESGPQAESGAARGSGGPSAGNSTDSGAAPLVSLARSRGRNWALPGSGRDSVGIARPIRVTCQLNQLVVLPERGTAGRARVVAVDRSVRSSIDEFVAIIRQETQTWGIAGPGVYWKPWLNVTVERGAEDRFAQLRALLSGSGIEVERKVQ